MWLNKYNALIPVFVDPKDEIREKPFVLEKTDTFTPGQVTEKEYLF
jgi:hypothetical protein